MNYLIETSLIRAAIKDSGSRYESYFDHETADGKLSTSDYVRMESIRRWICTAIRVALYVDSYRSLDDALNRVEQDFGARRVKANLSVVRQYVNSRIANHSAQQAAKEIGRLAVRWLRRFDRILKSRIPNKAGCQVGGKELRIDYSRLLDDLREFYCDFVKDVTTCGVNDFLDFKDPYGRTAKLLASEGVTDQKVGQNLRRLYAEGQKITCTQCERLGDAIIAMEQPKSHTLLSTDRYFEVLCRATGRKFRILRSLVDIDKEEVPSI
jgi:hypothetical protein